MFGMPVSLGRVMMYQFSTRRPPFAELCLPLSSSHGDQPVQEAQVRGRWCLLR